MSDPRSPKLAIFLDPPQEALVDSIIRACDLPLACIGGWSRSSALSARFSAPPCDDLRALLERTDSAGLANADLLLIASPGDFGSRPEDARAINAAIRRGVRLFSFSPIPQSPADLIHYAPFALANEHINFLPSEIYPLALPTHQPIMIEAAETIAAFGMIRSLSMTLTSRMGELSLGSRLFAAMDAVVAFMGHQDPAWIHAANTSSMPRPRVGALPESLNTLQGDIHALLKYDDARSAVLSISDSAGTPDPDAFELTLLGPQGRLFISHTRFTWFAPDGSVQDSFELPPQTSPAARIIAPMLAHLRSSTPASSDSQVSPKPLRAPHAQPISLRALILAHTALLSIRTGHPESPSTISHMFK